MKEIIVIEKSLYYYDKYFKYKNKLDKSLLSQNNKNKQLTKK